MGIDFVLILQQSFSVLFFVLLFVYTVYAIIFAYHWFTYGINNHISFVALAAYLCGGAVLFLTYSYALNTL